MKPPQQQAPLRLGRLELLRARREVLLDGRPLPLGGRAFDVLALLMEHSGEVVGQQELLDTVWQGTPVEPNNLQVQVWRLRRLLGRDVLRTIARRGYLLVPPLDGAPAAASAMPEAGAHDGTERPRLRWRPRPGLPSR